MDRIKLERDYWNQEAKVKDVDVRMHDAWLSTEEELKAILQGIKNPKMIIEIGCGTGRLLIPIAKKYPKANVLGVDISEEILKEAKTRAKFIKNLDFEYTQGRGFSREYKADLIYCVTVFQHIDEDGVRTWIKEVAKSLEKWGVLRFQFIEGTEREPFSNHYDIKIIKSMLEEAGLKLQKREIGLIHHLWTWITAIKE